MEDPVSPHFQTVDLGSFYNARRIDLPEALRAPSRFSANSGVKAIRGIPFLFGDAATRDVVLLEDRPVTIDLGGIRASYVLFVHAVEDATTEYLQGFADDQINGLGLGGLVAEYALEYEDGALAHMPIYRRFATQQSRYGWGSNPFACVSAEEDEVFPSAVEMQLLDRPVVDPAALGLDHSMPGSIVQAYAQRQLTRTISAVENGIAPGTGGCLWIYALPNPTPGQPIRKLILQPREERSTVYAVSTTELAAHPLRHERRQKARIQLPNDVPLNRAGEAERVRIDLGTVISARAALDYDNVRWADSDPVVEPSRSKTEVIVEYAAHPDANLYVGDRAHELGKTSNGMTTVAPAHRPVRLRFVDRETGGKCAVRLHLHGVDGEYLPPRGHHRKVNTAWGHDAAGEFVNDANQYAYIDGECTVDLPLGTVFIEATRGYEIAPLRTSFEVGPETDELLFELERVLHWRERGWVSADTHVHFLSPQTALLEGRAEDLNVVNLLAIQNGELYGNVADFDGTSTFGAESLGGSGEFLVRVGSENRTPVLGHISLLGYSGELIQPLSTGGPTEGAVGDSLESTLSDWAQRCIAQKGLVVLPHSPTPQLERAANVVLGLAQAIELKTSNPMNPLDAHSGGYAAKSFSGLSPYGIADWYRYLNLGYHVPVVSGSDKMSAAHLLGGARTYAHLGDSDFTYENWMHAVRAGNTFATIGPLTTMRVDGVEPGGQLRISSAGTVQVEWEVESVRVPIERVEVIVGGLVAGESEVGGQLSTSGHLSITVPRSTWIALRVRGSYLNQKDDIAAHTSAVQVLVGDTKLFSEPDSLAVLEQIQGAIAYVDTLATRPEARRLQALRSSLETAYNRLHQRMHRAGMYHRHPLHDHVEPHEH